MKRLWVAVIAASLVLAACDKPEDKFVGEYDGTIEVPPGLIEAMKLFAIQRGSNPDDVEAAMTSGTLAMELRGNGSCTMTTTFDEDSALTDGTWTLNDEGTQITVRIPIDDETAEARDLPSGSGRLRVLDVSEDGKTLTYEEERLNRTVVTTFTRK